MYVGTASGHPYTLETASVLDAVSVRQFVQRVRLLKKMIKMWKCLDDVNTKVTIQIAPGG